MRKPNTNANSFHIFFLFLMEREYIYTLSVALMHAKCALQKGAISHFFKKKVKKHLQKAVDNGRKMFAYLMIQELISKKI